MQLKRKELNAPGSVQCPFESGFFRMAFTKWMELQTDRIPINPSAYLIFVIFLTLTHFESCKFYTRKLCKFTTNGAQSSNFLVFLDIFYSQPKIYTHGVTGVPDKYQVCPSGGSMARVVSALLCHSLLRDYW